MHTVILQSEKIKAEALRLGFSACGIAKSHEVDVETEGKFREWIGDGLNAGMSYMEKHVDIRLNPGLLLDGCKSVICVALNYYPEKRLAPSQYQFAYYAYGKDYHDVLRKKLYELAASISSFAASLQSNVNFRVCADTAPLLERYWACQAGIGWIGKNHNLIIPHKGSYFFLGEILADTEVDVYDSPMPSHCGNCNKCTVACPGKAIGDDGTFNSERCLSYLTIEHRGSFSAAETELVLNQANAASTPYYIYGCDRCQIVCPHNAFASPTSIEDLHPSEAFMNMGNGEWEELSIDEYKSIFKGSAVKRAKYEGLKRNIDVVKKRD